MDNEMDSLFETYLFETNGLLEGLDELLIRAEKVGDFTEDDVNEIFRSMHTIKGSSAMLEFNSIMEIAHHIEDLFFFIRENGTSALTSQQKSELFNLMFVSTDRLREEIEKVENNEPLSTNIDSFVQEINNFLSKISNGGSGTEENGSPSDSGNAGAEAAGGESTAVLAGDVASCPCIIKIFFDEGCGMENLRALMLTTALNDNGFEFSFWPENIETDSSASDEIINHGFILGFSDMDTAEKASVVVSGTNNIHSYEIMANENAASASASKESEAPAAPAAGSEAAAAAPAAGGEKPASKQAAHQPGKQSLISVNLTKLDSLMALVGEIVTAESMVISSPDLNGLKLDNFMKSARQLRKLTDELQDISMSLRLVSVSGVFQKMNRIVRDMKKNLGKDVKLTLVGENTELDKTIVDNIGDPIMHIVRNSMDHGIEESAEDRIAAGKNPQGEIVLSAEHTGSEVIISIKDDGQGVNLQKVLAKAKSQGILVKPEEEYTPKEILALLMAPGFSTNSEVTEYSGRGVGMDVVKKNIEAIGGAVSITSEEGEGMCTTLKIPLTLSIVNGMEVSVGGSIFTVPISNIKQSFKAYDSDIIYDESGNEMIKCVDEFYPIIRLNRLFGITEDVCEKIDDGILMWVEFSDVSYCLFVDKLIGEQQIVVKPLPEYLAKFAVKDCGLGGCTILGDGNISIILDIPNIYYTLRDIY